MNNTEYLAFVQDRQKGIGGSDIATIFGQNPYETLVSLYKSKVEPITDADGNVFTRTGQLLEDYVANRFSRETGLIVKKPEIVTITDADVPYFRASLDRVINDDTVLEIKTTRNANRNELPLPTWLFQVQWYMGITGRKQAVICWLTLPSSFDYEKFTAKENYTFEELAIFDSFCPIDWVTIERDDEMIRVMREEADKFWNTYVVPKNPPQCATPDDVIALYPKIEEGKSIELDEHNYKLVLELKEAKAKEKEYKDKGEDLAKQIKLLFTDNESIKYNDTILATYKPQTTTRFDSTAFKNAEPSLYKQYTKESLSRTLLLKIK